MTGGGSAEPVSFLWLRDLAINDQVALLRYPRRTISAEVAGHIAGTLGGSVVMMPLRGASDRWKLSEPLASQLSRIREKLDKWWNSDALTNSERNYLIEHRADHELPPHTVRVDQPVIHAYLEMKVREAPPL
jgi:hypothetical protein